MARKRRVTRTQVIANLPNSVELTNRSSKNSMTLEIRTGHVLLGTLVMGRGSVQWWPAGNSVHALKKSWKTFAAVLDEHM
ncbi:MAG: hypothetical protein ABI833_24100 [Acidobacteriota bacterium]